jgi:hypothetical protein
MASPTGERAIEDALRAGNALLKFISPNDTRATESNQCGFYLPKSAWQMYSLHPPIDGRNDHQDVEITWQRELVTQSVIHWYGQSETKSEYRLTRFGRGFPYISPEVVGDLFVLIHLDHRRFHAYILSREEDIADVQLALGLEAFERWGVFQDGVAVVARENDCLEQEFARFAALQTDFPTGEQFSSTVHAMLQRCVRGLARQSPDAVLLRAAEAEFALFRAVEQQVCQLDIARPFRDIDDFIQTAGRLMNRRKSRAGRSLENHVEHLLLAAGLPHEMRPDIDGKPDVVIPSAAAYRDDTYPIDRLVILGIKTTCKDRWRQVLNEGQRVRAKHILTMQQGISASQLAEMQAAGVTLVVPERLHADYPTDRQIELLTVGAFIDRLRQLVGSTGVEVAGERRLF